MCSRVAILVSLALSNLGRAQDVSYEIIATSTMQASGAATGSTFLTIRTPAIGNSGSVAFGSSLLGAPSEADNGVWSGSSMADLHPICLEGNQAPGLASGTVFEPLSVEPLVGDSSEVSFSCQVSGTGVNINNDWTLWVSRSGQNVLMAREGDQVAGLPQGVVYGQALVSPFSYISTAPDGRSVFLASLVGVGVSASNNLAWVVELPQGATAVARKGGEVPNVPGVIHSSLSSASTAIDSGAGPSNTLTFLSTLTGSGVSSTNNEAVWRFEGRSLRSLVREGTNTYLPPGLTASGFTVVRSRAGRAAFLARLSGPGVTAATDSAVFLEEDGAVTTLVREGVSIPSSIGTVALGAIEDTKVAVNSEGQIALSAFCVPSGGGNTRSIVTGRGASLRAAAIVSGPAPGFPVGTVFTLFGIPAINEQGRVAFAAAISGPAVVSSGVNSLWRTDSTGEPVCLVIAEHTVLDVDPDPQTVIPKTVRTITFPTDLRVSMNDQGEVAALVEFTDLSNAVVKFGLPEPAACPGCAADYDQDGGVTGSDIGAFFADFEQGAPCADIDQDGGVTGGDLAFFFSVFEAGGC